MKAAAGIALGWLLGTVSLPAVAAHPASALPPAADPNAFRWHLPPGFPPPAVPAANPMTAAKVALGKRLFFDTRLSVTQSYSCGSCHQPERAFTDGQIRSVGATGGVLMRQAMTLTNIAYAVSLGWTEPGARSLETQMLTPMFNRHPVELGLTGRVQPLLQALAADASTAAAFAAAYPRSPQPSLRKIIDSIACYERSLIAARSAFDRYVFDDEREALSTGAKRGMDLFFGERLGCSGCHFGLNLGSPAAMAGKPRPAPLFADTGTGGRFKVPSLRNVALTAPYMHDGRFADLGAVLDHYEHARRDAPPGTALDSHFKDIHLEAGEKQDLIDFLNSLSDLQWP